MIIIEGTDMVGKSTFCEALSEQTGFLVQHMSKPPAMWPVPTGYIDLIGQHQIRDRFHLSAIAYRLATKEPMKLDIEKVRLISAHLTMVGAITVVITAEDCVIEKRYAHLKEREMYDLPTVLKANLQYSKLCNKATAISEVCQIDHHIHCTESRPFPTDADLSVVISKYRERIQCLEENLS